MIWVIGAAKGAFGLIGNNLKTRSRDGNSLGDHVQAGSCHDYQWTNGCNFGLQKSPITALSLLFDELGSSDSESDIYDIHVSRVFMVGQKNLALG